MKTPKDSRRSRPPVKATQQAKKPSGKRPVPRSPIANRQSAPKKRGVSPSKTPVRGNKQPVQQKPRLKGWVVSLGAIAALMATGGLVVGGIWLAIVLMIDPDSVVWLNQFLPEWTRISVAEASPPQTLVDIQNEVQKSGLTTGEPQSLNSELLVPILASLPNCQTDCQQIVELRVYQPDKVRGNETYYRLVTQFSVVGPEEYFVLSSPVTTNSEDMASSHSLPLTKLSRFDEKAPTSGFWFNLSGQRITEGTPVTYGQVIHYNPDQTHLSMMLQWTSAEQLQPYWQEVTGGSTPEFIVNQTVGLEPHFKVYQIKPRPFVPDPIYLEEISLVQPAIDTQAFRNALLLARNGLWSVALQSLKSQKKKNWSVAAQGQMDVIQLHAQVTEAQAKGAWASPSQQIFAHLIDGRWADALLVFQMAEIGAPIQEIVALLKSDSGALWNRVEAALKVNPNDTQAQAWGALILTAQQGRGKALSWLKQLSPSTTLASTNETPAIPGWIYKLLDHLEGTVVGTSPIGTHFSQIVGTAQLVKNVNPKDWQQPGESYELGVMSDEFNNQLSSIHDSSLSTHPSQKQVWYKVQVAAFNDGQAWQRSPFSNLPSSIAVQGKSLWALLGLNIDPRIQITVWTAEGRQESTIATVKAVVYKGGSIQLLAEGEALPAATGRAETAGRGHLLAYTETGLRWLEPESITLSDLYQLQPQWVTAIVPSLWRELLKSGNNTISRLSPKTGEIPSTAVMLNKIGHWSVRLIDLTGNNQTEAVLTLYEDLSKALEKPDAEYPIRETREVSTGRASQSYKPRTLIFADTGALLYSEFSKNTSASLTAIADLADGGPAALVINNPNTYSLKRWSTQNQRFE